MPVDPDDAAPGGTGAASGPDDEPDDHDDALFVLPNSFHRDSPAAAPNDTARAPNHHNDRTHNDHTDLHDDHNEPCHNPNNPNHAVPSGTYAERPVNSLLPNPINFIHI